MPIGGISVAIELPQFLQALELLGIVVSGPVKAIELDGDVVRVHLSKAIEEP